MAAGPAEVSSSSRDNDVELRLWIPTRARGPDGTGLICGSSLETLSPKPCLVVVDRIKESTLFVEDLKWPSGTSKEAKNFIIYIHNPQHWTSKGSACFKVVVRLLNRVSFITPVHPQFLSSPPLLVSKSHPLVFLHNVLARSLSVLCYLLAAAG